MHESNGTNVEVHKGDRLFLSIGNASKDVREHPLNYHPRLTPLKPKAFPNPEIINPDRPKEDYYSFGRSEYTCFEEIFTDSVRISPKSAHQILNWRTILDDPLYPSCDL